MPPKMEAHKVKTDHLPDQWKKYIISGTCFDISNWIIISVAYVTHMKKPSEITLTYYKEPDELRRTTLNH